MEKVKKKAYSCEIDILRGFATILVVLGHILQYSMMQNEAFYNDFLFKGIYSFHMPLFMCISGFLFKHSYDKYGKKTYIYRQLLSLGKVILIWNAIQWILNCLLGVYSFDCIVDVMKSAYTAFSGLWYIWALLIIQVVVASVYMKKYAWAIYILMMLILSLIPIKIVSFAYLTAWMLPFFLLGLYLSETPKLLSYVISKFMFLAVFIMFIAGVAFYRPNMFVYKSGMNIFDSQYGIIVQIGIVFYRVIVALLGMIVIKELLLWCYKKNENSRFVKWLIKISHYSLHIYILQRILIETLAYQLIRGKSLSSNVVWFDWIVAPVMSVFFCKVLAEILNSLNIRYKKIFHLLFGR